MDYIHLWFEFSFHIILSELVHKCVILIKLEVDLDLINSVALNVILEVMYEMST